MKCLKSNGFKEPVPSPWCSPIFIPVFPWAVAQDLSSKPLVTSGNQNIWHSPARTGSGDFQKEGGESPAEQMAPRWVEELEKSANSEGLALASEGWGGPGVQPDSWWHSTAIPAWSPSPSSETFQGAGSAPRCLFYPNLRARRLKVPAFAHSQVKNNVTFGELISGRLISRALLGIVVAVQRVSSACTTAQRSSSACTCYSGVQFHYTAFGEESCHAAWDQLCLLEAVEEKRMDRRCVGRSLFFPCSRVLIY